MNTEIFVKQDMLKGKCLACGREYFGWALLLPRNQSCDRCGATLEISDRGKILRRYSPFKADGYIDNESDIKFDPRDQGLTNQSN